MRTRGRDFGSYSESESEDEKDSYSDYTNQYSLYNNLRSKRDVVVDKNLEINVSRGIRGSLQREPVSKNLPLGDVIDALFSMSSKEEIAIRLNPKSTAETIIRRPSKAEGDKGYFAVMTHNGETYKLKNEDYTWKSGPIAALSKKDTRVVFERSGTFFGKWRSRSTDHVGFKETFLGNLGLSMTSQVEVECRSLLDSRVALREMANILEDIDWDTVGRSSYLDPKKMALVDCVRYGAFNKAPHPGLSSYSSPKTNGETVKGLSFASDGKTFAIRADENSKTLVFLKMDYKSRQKEWVVATPQELSDHKIYDKAIKLFGIDEAAYQEFSKVHHENLGIPYRERPESASFARSGNFLSSAKLASKGLFKLPEEEVAKNAFILAAHHAGLTSGQAFEILFNRTNLDDGTFEEEFNQQLNNAGIRKEEVKFKQEDVDNFFEKDDKKFTPREVLAATDVLKNVSQPGRSR